MLFLYECFDFCSSKLKISEQNVQKAIFFGGVQIDQFLFYFLPPPEALYYFISHNVIMIGRLRMRMNVSQHPATEPARPSAANSQQSSGAHRPLIDQTNPSGASSNSFQTVK